MVIIAEGFLFVDIELLYKNHEAYLAILLKSIFRFTLLFFCVLIVLEHEYFSPRFRFRKFRFRKFHFIESKLLLLFAQFMRLCFVDIEQAHISHISNKVIITEVLSFVDIGLLHKF